MTSATPKRFNALRGGKRCVHQASLSVKSHKAESETRTTFAKTWAVVFVIVVNASLE